MSKALALPGQLPLPFPTNKEFAVSNDTINLDSPWSADELANLHAVHGGRYTTVIDGRVVATLTRREAVDLMRRFPTMYPEPAAPGAGTEEDQALAARYPSMSAGKAAPPPTTGDAAEDAKLAARYPSTKW